MRLISIALVTACSAPVAHPEIAPPPAPVRPDAAIDAASDAATSTDAAAAVALPPDAEPFDCAEPCTDYAVCWERVHKGQDFRRGGACVDDCETMAPADQVAWAKSVATALRTNRCKRVVDDD